MCCIQTKIVITFLVIMLLIECSVDLYKYSMCSWKKILLLVNCWKMVRGTTFLSFLFLRRIPSEETFLGEKNYLSC